MFAPHSAVIVDPLRTVFGLLHRGENVSTAIKCNQPERRNGYYISFRLSVSVRTVFRLTPDNATDGISVLPTESARGSRPIVGWRSPVPAAQLAPARPSGNGIIRGASRKVLSNSFFFLNHFISTGCDAAAAAAAVLAGSTSTAVHASLSVGRACVRAPRRCRRCRPSLCQSTDLAHSQFAVIAAVVAVTVVASSDGRV